MDDYIACLCLYWDSSFICCQEPVGHTGPHKTMTGAGWFDEVCVDLREAKARRQAWIREGYPDG